MILNPIVGRNGRMQAFTPKFMEQFKSEHESAFPGTAIDNGGMPDQGNGWYS
jgi:hypothetical protein